MGGALEGVRIVDLGHYIAGPAAAVMLADQGADVIRIDRPSSEANAPEEDAFLQRGKRRIELDLKDGEDLETAQRLIERADVLIENFRPGVMDRLGLGWQRFSTSAPGLVYCSIPGFASGDPRAQVPGWEGVVAAATGNCRVRNGEAPAGWDMNRPTYSALPLASNFAAVVAAYAIVSSLVERQRSGRGERVEVPLFNAMFELIGGAGVYIEEKGLAPERPLVRCGSGTYRCRDGRYVQFNPIGTGTRFLRWFLDAAGMSAWIAEGLTSYPQVETDPELAAELRDRLRELFSTRSAQEWEDVGRESGVPLCMVRTSAEWLSHVHARASGQVVDLDDPELGWTRMAGRSVVLSDFESASLQPRREPDADRAQILAELESAAPALDQTGDATGTVDPAFTGFRVLDLTQILAGPTAGRVLAEFGADVVKMNSPQRKVDVHGFVNRGKRSILLDLESPGSQDVLWKMIDEADVVTQNLPPSTARRYGLAHEHISARNPEIVYVSVSCYGQGGSWSSGRGYETQGQAATGIMERAGRVNASGGQGRPSVLGPYNVLDYGTGIMAAFGAALGLYHRLKTGQGLEVRTSLAQLGCFHQGSFMMDHATKKWDEPAGPDALGAGPLMRYYRAADRWFFLGATREQWDALRAVPGLQAISAMSPDAPGIDDALEAAFSASKAEHWISVLRDRDIGAHEVMSLAEVMVDPCVREQGLSISTTSEEVGEVVMPGSVINMERQRVRVGAPARQPGADGRDVLTELGLDAGEIDDLERGWVVQLHALPTGWKGF